MPVRIGIDLGGTKIEAAALDDAGVVLGRGRVPTPRHDYEATIAAITVLVQELEARFGRAASVGAGIPGSLSPVTGVMRNANSVWLNGRSLAQDLELALGRPVPLANDANCFALSEARDGAGSGARVVFGVILGTGVGGGLVVDGRIWPGRNGVAGEWGHDPLPWMEADEATGPTCWCGRRGCVETWLSGPALARDHGAPGLDAEEVVSRAAEGEPAAEAALQRYEARLARALGAIINVLDPDVIVLGGGLSNVARLYQRVPQLWSRHVFSDSVTTLLLPPAHGDSSGVRGAAWVGSTL